MKSVIRVYDMKKSQDIKNIQKAISRNEGVIACEFSLEKREVLIIYNESFIKLEAIIDSIEETGYMVI